ncbi:MAG: YheV family putative metal-binding protein [Pseudomonadales bacterium]|uniref:YheV family putative zinc ribbon protein n=1 Tax=Marinobacter xestospongiae TaxID=994319 RepID=UPI0020030070|nr:YheV family putative zinc ribbon protein [Marinobacter xestospongiae]MCG8520268.1 YheV family putative metal-binding protein [Pseudomonadales bacterium]MCK7567969.1 YheV family putative metal-binding protein [Marinobacter xestospongiae]
MASPKRFIAGAVCPRCAEMDKIVMYSNDDGQFRECVACGYHDKQGEAEVAELDTRVNQRSNRDDHTVKQVVFFKAGQED